VRWKEKAGIQDLKKSISYVQKRIESLHHVHDHDEIAHYAGRRFTVPTLQLFKCMEDLKLPPIERQACMLILCWDTEKDLDKAITLISYLIEQANDQTN
jgi:hypothetical protein